MKKLLCFILVVIMVAGINVNVFANTADNNQESGITLYYEDGGTNGTDSKYDDPELKISTNYILEGSYESPTAVVSWQLIGDTENPAYDLVIKQGDVIFAEEKGLTDNTYTTGILNPNMTYSYSITLQGSDVSVENTIYPALSKVEISSMDYSYGNTTSDYITIKWTKPETASLNSKYVIYYATSKTGTYNQLAEINNVSATSYKLLMSDNVTKDMQTATGVAYVKIRTVSSNNSSIYYDSAVKSIKPDVPIMRWKVTAKKKIKLYKKGSGSSYYKYVNGYLGYYQNAKYPNKLGPWDKPKRIKVKVDGKYGWVDRTSVSVKPAIKAHDKYKFCAKTAEDYAKNYSSKSKYMIWTSQYTQRVYIFKGKKGSWDLIKTFPCTTGVYHHKTTNKVSYVKSHLYKKTKSYKDGRLYYFRYSTSFGGSGTFHTRCKWTSSNKWRNSINAAKPTTLGCVRLYDDGAKYIYGLPRGTRVVIH